MNTAPDACRACYRLAIREKMKDKERTMFYGRRVVFHVVAIALSIAACTKSQAEKCTSDSDCTDSTYPFCDTNGEYPASGGQKNVCTVTPQNCPVERCGCSPGATTCSNDQLATCDAGGKSVTTVSCPMGCATDGTRCLSFAPSNGLQTALTAAPTEPAITIPSGSTINTTTGEVKNSGGLPISVHAIAVSQGASTIEALIGSSFSIGDVRVTGSNALAIVSSGDVTLSGVFDASADLGAQGPGASATTAACTGQAGSDGGGGAGNATAGGDGARLLDLDPIVHGGAAQTGFEPLTGGCSGGMLSGNSPQQGGGGGGAIQIVSSTQVSLGGTIDVGGGGGGYSGGGGGAGGNVVIEAPHVAFGATAAGVFANGGSGGACSALGADGRRGTSASPGPGPCGTRNGNVGGSGGTVTQSPSSGSSDAVSGGAGGGGGAVGRILISTRNGMYELGPAVISAAVTTGTLVPQ